MPQGTPAERRSNSVRAGDAGKISVRKIHSGMRSFEADDAEMTQNGYGFCHHCKQVKNKYLLARCNYNSSKMGHTVPASYTVRNVKIYNSKYQLIDSI